MNGKFIYPTASFSRKKRNDDMPLDFKKCINIFGGDRKAVSGLIKEFIKGLDSQHKVIGDALDGADCETVRKEAHSIKGGAAVLSAHPLMAAAALLEEAGKTGDLEEGVKRFRLLEIEIAQLSSYWTELKKRKDQANPR